MQQMMIEDGFEASVYDIYFHPDRSVLDAKYDFITCTETAEHFGDPRGEFDRFDGRLRRGGWLGVMTGMLQNLGRFPLLVLSPRPDACEFLQPRDDALDCGALRLGGTVSEPECSAVQEGKLI